MSNPDHRFEPVPGSAGERRPPFSLRRALLVGAVGLVIVVGLVLVGTREEQPAGSRASGQVAVGHIHGIGVDPDDGQLYIGAHLGLFSVAPDGEVSVAGEERNDTMAFTVAGPGRFLASGHPELGSDQPVHLGLIETTDAADSWAPVSLAGEADFHALDVTEGRTWGVDSARGLLLTTVDNRDWRTAAQGSFLDVAADPASPDTVLATTDTGGLRFYDNVGSAKDVLQSPVLTFIDWPTRKQLVGLGPDGTVFVSATAGASWQGVGKVPGQPTALEVTESEWYAATDQGLFSSTDAGVSWNALFAFGDGP